MYVLHTTIRWDRKGYVKLSFPATIQNSSENEARETAWFLAIHMCTCQSDKDYQLCINKS